MQDMHSSPAGDNNAMLSIASTLLSVISFVGANATQSNVAWGFGIVCSCVAIISGVMAIRYYYYATKKLKNESEENK